MIAVDEDPDCGLTPWASNTVKRCLPLSTQLQKKVIITCSIIREHILTRLAPQVCKPSCLKIIAKIIVMHNVTYTRINPPTSIEIRSIYPHGHQPSRQMNNQETNAQRKPKVLDQNQTLFLSPFTGALAYPKTPAKYATRFANKNPVIEIFPQVNRFHSATSKNASAPMARYVT